VLEVVEEVIVGRMEIIQHHFGFPDERHKIGVSDPPGDDMHMIMIRHTCSCAVANVHPGVETLRLIMFFQDAQTFSEEFHHFS
jgi:hypothetical protein